MLQKKDTSVIILALLLTMGIAPPIFGKYGKIDSVSAQTASKTTSFPVPDKVADNTKIKIDGSSWMTEVNQTLKKEFESKFPTSKIEIQSTGADPALKSLEQGKIDLAAVSRPLTKAEKAKGLVEVPIKREKIAIIVGKDNSFNGNLTFQQFAKIFRGEIKNWSQVGGKPGAIRLIDRPNTSDTRNSFQKYPVFQNAKFATGANAEQIKEDSTDKVIQALGKNGISYALVSQIAGKDTVKAIAMHKVLPDNPKYPFSQPLAFVYKGKPNPGVQAFLGYATGNPGQQAIAGIPVAAPGTISTNTTTSASNTNTTNPNASDKKTNTTQSGETATTNSANVDATGNNTNNGNNPAGANNTTSTNSDLNKGTGKIPGWWWWLLPIPLLGLLFWGLSKKRRQEASRNADLNRYIVSPITETEHEPISSARIIGRVPRDSSNNTSLNGVLKNPNETVLGEYNNRVSPANPPDLQETQISNVVELNQTPQNIVEPKTNIVDKATQIGGAALAAGLGAAGLSNLHRQDNKTQTDETETVIIPPDSEPSLLDRLGNRVSNITEAAKENTSNLVDATKQKTGDLVEGVTNTTSNLVDATKQKTGDLVEGVTNTTSNLVDATKQKTTDLVEGVTNTTSNLVDATKQKTGDLVEGVTNTTSNLVDATKQKTTDLVEGLTFKTPQVPQIQLPEQSKINPLQNITQTGAAALATGLGALGLSQLGQEKAQSNLPVVDETKTTEQDSTNWIDELLGKAGDVTDNATQSVKDKVSDLVNRPTQTTQTPTTEDSSDWLDELLGKGQDVVNNANQTVADAAETAKNKLADVVNLPNRTTQAPVEIDSTNWIDELLGKAGDVADNVGQNATNLVETAKDKVANVAENLPSIPPQDKSVNTTTEVENDNWLDELLATASNLTENVSNKASNLAEDLGQKTNELKTDASKLIDDATKQE